MLCVLPFTCCTAQIIDYFELLFAVYQGLIRTCSHPVALDEVCISCGYVSMSQGTRAGCFNYHLAKCHVLTQTFYPSPSGTVVFGRVSTDLFVYLSRRQLHWIQTWRRELSLIDILPTAVVNDFFCVGTLYILESLLESLLMKH